MAPENFMEKEVFDSVSSYIIPKPELKDRLITITTRDYKIVGCPVCMEVCQKCVNVIVFLSSKDLGCAHGHCYDREGLVIIDLFSLS